MVHAALLLLMLGARTTVTPFHHQPEAQHPKSSAIHKNAGRLPHLLARSEHSPLDIAVPHSAAPHRASTELGCRPLARFNPILPRQPWPHKAFTIATSDPFFEHPENVRAQGF